MPAPLPLRRAALAALAVSLFAHWALLGRGHLHDEAPRPAQAVRLALLPMPAARPAPPAPMAPAAGPPSVHPRADAPAAKLEAPLDPTNSPSLRLAGPATWRYRLRQRGQDGEAVLAWQPQPDGHYSLRLTRQVGERELPAWVSQGRFGGTGLSPEHFAQQLGERERRVVSVPAGPGGWQPPEGAEGAQDRLSWWLQLAALVQAAPTPGGRWRVWVAGLHGELREWAFEAVPAGEADDVRLLHLRRQPLGTWDPGIDLWLDPTRGYWPVRLRQGDPEARGYEIWSVDVNS